MRRNDLLALTAVISFDHLIGSATIGFRLFVPIAGFALALASCSRAGFDVGRRPQAPESLPLSDAIADQGVLGETGIASDLSSRADRPLPGACSWHTVPLPEAYANYDLADVGGWTGNLLVAASSWDKTSSPWKWLGSVVLQYQAGKWSLPWASPGPVVKLLARGPFDIYAIGNQRANDGVTFKNGFIARYASGNVWTMDYTSTLDNPFNIASLQSGEPVVVGCVLGPLGGTCAQGLIMVQQVTGWTRNVTSAAVDLDGVWGTAESIYAAGWPGSLVVVTTGGVQALPGTGSGRFFVIWNSTSGLIIAGSPGIYRYSAGKIAQLFPATTAIYDVWSPSPSLAFAAGCRVNAGSCTAATVLRYDGLQTWKALPDPPGTGVGGIWGTGECDLWAVGGKGSTGLQHYAP